MNVERKFMFTDTRGELRVTIPEVVDPKYGMFTWPSAPVLAQYIWYNRKSVEGKKVLEMGAGTSLPGIVAALCGGLVTLTDSEDYPECLENCHRSCQANRLSEVNILGLTWGQFSPNLLGLPHQDIILGSDCFFDPKDFDDILATVSFLMDQNPQCCFWTTYQERSSDWSITHNLKKWSLQCLHIPLNTFQADGEFVGGSKLARNHTIQMLEITKH